MYCIEPKQSEIFFFMIWTVQALDLLIASENVMHAGSGYVQINIQVAGPLNGLTSRWAASRVWEIYGKNNKILEKLKN